MALLKITARFDSRCKTCGEELDAGDVVWWDKDKKGIYCPACAVNHPLYPKPVPGTAPPTSGAPAAQQPPLKVKRVPVSGPITTGANAQVDVEEEDYKVLHQNKSTSSAAVHEIRLSFNTGLVYCTCRGYSTHGLCWHIKDWVPQNPGSTFSRPEAEAYRANWIRTTAKKPFTAPPPPPPPPPAPKPPMNKWAGIDQAKLDKAKAIMAAAAAAAKARVPPPNAPPPTTQPFSSQPINQPGAKSSHSAPMRGATWQSTPFPNFGMCKTCGVVNGRFSGKGCNSCMRSQNGWDPIPHYPFALLCTNDYCARHVPILNVQSSHLFRELCPSCGDPVKVVGFTPPPPPPPKPKASWFTVLATLEDLMGDVAAKGFTPEMEKSYQRYLKLKAMALNPGSENEGRMGLKLAIIELVKTAFD